MVDAVGPQYGNGIQLPTGLNPGISMGINPPQGPSGPAANPLGMVDTMMDIRNKSNVNTEFQQKQNARSQMGHILADPTTKDMNDAVQKAGMNPNIGPYAPEMIHEIANVNGQLISNVGAQQGQQDTALTGYLKQLARGLADPSQLKAVESQYLGNLPPELQKTMKKTLDDVTEKLTLGLDVNDPASRQLVQRRIIGAMAGVGLGSEQVQTALGLSPTTRQTSAYGTTTGGLAGPAGGPNGEAPNTYIPGGNAPQGPLLQGPTPGQPAVSGNPQPQPQPQPQPPPASGAPQPPVPGGPKGVNPNLPEHQNIQDTTTAAVDGKPLLAPVKDPYQYRRTDQGSLEPAINGPQTVANDAMVKNYTGDGYKQFQDAQQAATSLSHMRQDLDQSAAGGAFLGPGAEGENRTEFAKAMQKGAQLLHFGEPFDPGQLAFNEDMMKNTRRLGAALTQQLLPGDNAASTISNMQAAVPSLNNTYMGARLLLAGYQSLVQRQMDYRRFQTKWMETHHGLLLDSDTEFERQHPADEIANHVFDSMGMTADGKFKSHEVILNAIKNGWLTKEQGFKLGQDKSMFAPPDKNVLQPTGGQ